MNEAERLFKDLLEYARKKREEGVYDFTYILSSYNSQVLEELVDSSKNASAKKFSDMIKDYELTDPQYQKKLTGFY